MPKATTAGTRSRTRSPKPKSKKPRIVLTPDKSEQDVWRELLAQDGLEWLGDVSPEELVDGLQAAEERLAKLTPEALGRIDAAKAEAELIDRQTVLKYAPIIRETELAPDPSPERLQALCRAQVAMVNTHDAMLASSAKILFDARAVEYLALARSKREALLMIAMVQLGTLNEAEKAGLCQDEDALRRYQQHLEPLRCEWEARVHRGEFGRGEAKPDRHDTAPTDNIAAIGQAIRHFREQRGWSQDDLVEESKKTTAEGINKRSLQRYEKGAREMRPRTKMKLLKTLGINAEDFDREVTKRRQNAAK